MTKKAAVSTVKDSPESSITTIRKITCKNLQGTATLTYQIGDDDAGNLHWKISSNTGAGMFSDEWVAFKDIQKALNDWPKDSPITSMVLRPLFQGKSVNTPSFLLATLVKEGILEPVPDKQRHYQLGDAKPFLDAVSKHQSGHSKPGKPKAKVKAKAAARIPKGKAKLEVSK